jgi:hypothetical protein
MTRPGLEPGPYVEVAKDNVHSEFSSESLGYVA